MDAMMKPDFEAGLTNLKVQAEASAARVKAADAE